MESFNRGSSENRPIPVIQRVSARTIPGVLANNNKGAIDWGWQSLVAYGCQNHVVVIDTKYVKVLQTLEKHKSNVVKVKWAKELYYHDTFNPYNLRLASADLSGSIIVWDVKQAVAKSVCSDGNKGIADMEWITGHDTCQHLLVALHPPNSLILWNTENATKIWKKTYSEVLLSFSFDPFNEMNIAFLASDCILFVDDFNLNKVPVSNGRKFYISNPSSSSQSAFNSGSSNQHSSVDDKTKYRNVLLKRMRVLIRADSKTSGEEGVTLNECLQLSYHRSYKHHLLLLYPREVLILDLEINQTVGIVALEQNSSSMSQLYSCWQRDALFCLHESGNISFRLRHKGMINAALTPCDGDQFLEIVYDLQCQSDSVRFTKRIMGMCICPVTEMKAAILLSDGRMIFFELISSSETSDIPLSASLTTLACEESSDFSKLFIQNSLQSKSYLSFDCNTPHPKSILSDNIKGTFNISGEVSAVRFKFLLTGVLSALVSPPLVIRMCPPVTFRNWSAYRPLLAVGNSNGGIQVFNIATGVMERDFSLHCSPVRGIEWVSLTAFLSYAHPNVINSLGQVRNELMLTDVQSGRNQTLRDDRHEESPIQLLRVSYLRQYFIIVFKDEPFELWDLRTLTLLRSMSKNVLNITALEWFPQHFKKHSHSAHMELRGGNLENTYSFADSISDNQMSTKSLIYTKEHFVFTDTNGQLYHFSVEGNVIKDGSTIPPDAGMGSITCIAWKGDIIILGDVDGNLTIWNLKNKISKSIPTQRGWIKKIRFGPGRGNMKFLVLFNDGIDLWDVKDAQLISKVKCPREMPKIQDLDWVGSDRPGLSTADGCIRITDINLKTSSSPLQDYQPSELSFIPHLLPTKTALTLKSIMANQAWKEKYSLDITEQDGFSNEEELALVKMMMKSLDHKVQKYLPICPYGVAERCLHVARLFGDEDSFHFWTVAIHFLKQEKFKLSTNIEKKSTSSISNLNSFVINQNNEEEYSSEMQIIPNYVHDQSLDINYDILCSSSSFKQLQLECANLHVSKSSTYIQNQKCAENLILLGEKEKAVQILLETDSDNENFYTDSLRACLIATINSSGASQSVIKLAATNLIASGHISQGVQLLCLIDKGLDACRYLQGAGNWEQAVWLAKATLNSEECLEVMKRWTDHLCSPQIDQKNKALLVLLSMNQFLKVLELLHSFKMTERTVMFLQSCYEFGIIEKQDMSSSLAQAIYLNYSRYLLTTKNYAAALYYSELAGKEGSDLKKEIEILMKDL